MCFTNGKPQQEAQRREESEVRVFILLVPSYEVSLSSWCPSTEVHYSSQGVCPTQLSHMGSRTSPTSYLFWSRAGDYSAIASPRFLNTLPTPFMTTQAPNPLAHRSSTGSAFWNLQQSQQDQSPKSIPCVVTACCLGLGGHQEVRSVPPSMRTQMNPLNLPTVGDIFLILLLSKTGGGSGGGPRIPT